jgi:hypothetical protein
MPIYLTGCIDAHIDRWKHYHADILPLGMIVQPLAYRQRYPSRAGLYDWVAIDNGRFTAAGRRLFRPADYDRLIGVGLGRAGDRLLFATAPDVPFDWGETLRLSRPGLRRIRRLGCPAALCAQEGMMLASIPWDEFDCLFVGGRGAFKEGPIVREACREARRRGKWVHMGRVNGLRRLLVALKFGADSVDGTYLLHEARKGRAGEGPPVGPEEGMLWCRAAAEQRHMHAAKRLEEPKEANHDRKRVLGGLPRSPSAKDQVDGRDHRRRDHIYRYILYYIDGLTPGPRDIRVVAPWWCPVRPG